MKENERKIRERVLRAAIKAPLQLNGWYMTGVDVHTAYLYGKLDEEIYMHQPKGFVTTGQENKVIPLQRALYGLKQAGLA